MEASDSNLVVTRMIRAGEVSLSELERLLDSLEGQQLITTAELEALLELAWKINTEKPPCPDLIIDIITPLPQFPIPNLCFPSENQNSRCEPIHLRRSDLR